MSRILGIDPGERKIGVAISDETELIARPLSILQHQSAVKDAAEVARLAAGEGVSRIVVGLPLDADGEEGPRARRVRRWAEALGQACPLPIDFWDESFSTAAAASAAPRRRRPRRGQPRFGPGARSAHDDAGAAAVILQEYLDARRDG